MRVIRWIVGVVVVVLVLGGAILLSMAKTRAAPVQPVEFNHQLMVGMGIQCLFCHVDATRSPAAGIPSVQRCMGCHATIAKDAPEVKKLASYWEAGEPIPWVRINRPPRFVYFSHHVHVVAAGLNCERCHDDVSKMPEIRPVLTMNMGWCLDCHNQQPNAAQLRDCVVCHQ
jgi:c(7)-type cytochrome triheme protein